MGNDVPSPIVTPSVPVYGVRDEKEFFVPDIWLVAPVSAVHLVSRRVLSKVHNNTGRPRSYKAHVQQGSYESFYLVVLVLGPAENY
ncbi:hypothetical protein M569_08879 [Genlisea aurea]|uniref:Uncharacterized protein n=1 Tax=Genlisea aurea TaxID=192259 RepID=S8DS22_9LAMI|nr:hypothetical protein M569_08879 [Genlisea aurea]